MNTRPGAVIVRWGGDEFLLLLPDLGRTGGMADATRLIDAVRAARPAPPWDGLPVSVSVGACPTRRTPLPLHQLDEALGRSKKSGKGRVTFFNLEENGAGPSPAQ